MDEKHSWSDPDTSLPTNPLLGNEFSESIRSGYGGLKSPTTDSSLGISFNANGKKLKPYRRYGHEVLLALVCGMDAICGGFILAFTSPTVPMLKAQGMLDDEQATWFESMMPLGAIGGSLLVSWLAHLTGRKTTTYITAVPSVVGWICIIVAKSYVLLYVGRLFTGVAGGMLIIICILYIAEGVSKEVRGAMVMSFNVMLASGALLIYCFGMVLNTQWLAVVSIVPTVVMAVGLVFIPESPRWLIQKGRHSDAVAALMWLRQDTFENIQPELQEIKQNVKHQEEMSAHLESRKELRRLWKPLAIVVTLFILQQFCGINVVQFNLQEIFTTAGFSGSGSIPAIIIAVVQVLSPLLGLFLVDRLGRRLFLIVGGVILALSTAVMGLYFYFQDNLQDYAWISVLALIAFMSSHAVSLGSIPWMVMAEIIPLQFRSWASGFSAAVSWASAFVILKVFQPIALAIGWSGLFWMFSVVSIFSVIFAILVMPETKHRSLENIEHEFSISILSK